MQQLSEHAAAFIADDSARANANVSLLHIYDQSTAPGGKVRFKTLLAHIESRLGESPVFRHKLAQVPLGLDLPYWVEDEHFDLEYHVRHIALPKPGDWRQFCIQVSRIHSRALDLSRPLWEIYVIEGLDSWSDLPAGSFALLSKSHHAAVDVAHDSRWATLLHDASPLPPAPAPPPPWFPRSPPHPLPLMARGVFRLLSSPGRAAAPLARRLRQAAPSGLTLAGRLWLSQPEVPAVRFNAVVSPHRVFETRRFALADFERIRKRVRGASLNDAVLAVCGGALRAYLEVHDELPPESLSALMPARASAGETDDEGSTAQWQRVSLCTDVADPLQRLRAISRQTGNALSASSAGGRALARNAREIATLALGGSQSLPAHCSIVPLAGPSVPMYLCGARLSYFSAMLPIADGIGLSFAVSHCDGRVVISPTSCRELTPDPERFAQCLRDSFQAMLAMATAPRPRSLQRRA